jgi:putative ABC transport system substrate-binding protein
VRRRYFIKIIAGSAIAWSLAARAQQSSNKIPVVGVLWHAGNEKEEAVYLRAFRAGLRDAGQVEGQSILLEQRFANEQYELFNSMAADLIARKVDILVAVSPPAAMAAKRTGTSIPVVFIIHPDPVGSKLVDSLAHPGGNITGLSNLVLELSAKRLELFKEAIPKLSRIGLLVNPRDPEISRRAMDEMAAAAGTLNLSTLVAEAHMPNQLDSAFVTLANGHPDGVVTMLDSMFNNERKKIAALALEHRLPTMVHTGEMVKDGGFISYGADFADLFRRAADYVDLILKGARPSDLPVQQPTKFELAINLKTAKLLGLDVPPTLLARADEVIE